MKKIPNLHLAALNLSKSQEAIASLLETAIEMDLIDISPGGNVYWSSCGEFLDRTVKEEIN